MLGVGGVFVVALSSYFGRLPVLFWFTMTAVWTAAGCAGSATFEAVRKDHLHYTIQVDADVD